MGPALLEGMGIGGGMFIYREKSLYLFLQRIFFVKYNVYPSC